MCLVAFAYKIHPRYELVLVENRDEFYRRESTAMHWWSDQLVSGNQTLLAGRDELAGGTWFGVTRSGDWAALTNFRERHREIQQTKTRGVLVTSFLLGEKPPNEFLDDLQRTKQCYNGFNLLLSHRGEIVSVSSRSEESKLRVEALKPGLYGLSNHFLDTDWPKVKMAKSSLASKMERDEIQANDLVWTLFDDSHPTDDQLPDTGVGIEKERLLGPMFIASEELQYGTRCTTAMTITHGGEISVVEKSYPAGSLAEFAFNRVT